MRVDPELVERFRADLAPLWPSIDDEAFRLGIALSGGGDSLALLLLAHSALPGRVEAATVDHGLRPESAAEAQTAADYCHELGVPHVTLQVNVEPGNMQDRARAARYEALGQWCDERELDALATAHQADDQAETFLMRLNRGSGIEGLSAVRALGTIPGKSIALVRSLLGWRREELAKIVARAGWTPVVDPSNENQAFDRIRMRRHLADNDWLDVAAIGQSVRHLAEAAETLRWAIDREQAERVTFDGQSATYRAGRGGTLLQGGVIRAIFRHFGVQIDQGTAATLVEALSSKKKVNVAGMQAEVSQADGEELWLFRPENPRRTG